MIRKICGVNKTDNPDMISEWEGWDAITLCPLWRKYGVIVENKLPTRINIRIRVNIICQHNVTNVTIKSSTVCNICCINSVIIPHYLPLSFPKPKSPNTFCTYSIRPMSRQKLTLRLNADVIKQAKELGMNLSGFMEIRLRE